MISKIIRALTILTIITATFAYAPTATADEISDTEKFRKVIKVANIRKHQQKFQTFANNNGGNRVSGTGGFDDSAQYVYDRMTDAGYNVSFQEFTFTFVGDRTPPVLNKNRKVIR